MTTGPDYDGPVYVGVEQDEPELVDADVDEGPVPAAGEREAIPRPAERFRCVKCGHSDRAHKGRGTSCLPARGACWCAAFEGPSAAALESRLGCPDCGHTEHVVQACPGCECVWGVEPARCGCSHYWHDHRTKQHSVAGCLWCACDKEKP